MEDIAYDGTVREACELVMGLHGNYEEVGGPTKVVYDYCDK